MKSARIDLRISEDLKARVVAEADRRGQKITTFIERALETALCGGDPEGSGMRVSAERPAPSRASADVQQAAFDAGKAAMDRQRLMNKAKGLS